MSARARILVVEDNASLRRGIVRALAEPFGEVEAVADGRSACERVADPEVPAYDVVLTDLRLPSASGIDVLRAARKRDARTSVIVMTAHGTIEAAVEAMRLGAHDFLEKPFELEQLELRVGRAVEHVRLVREVGTLRAERAQRHAAKFARERIVGRSPVLGEALDLATRVASSRSTILITGETGTGKELVAGLIHGASPRSARPFVKVNCAALPETLLESELFGHERGAFTGAERQRIGRFEQADGGTLFLDEVADMSLATQAKLLRVLQDGEFHRLGGVQPLRVDVRIVAATNRDLKRAVVERVFREDLYFRLHVIHVHLPALRDRGDDATFLSHHFLRHFSEELGRARVGFSHDALTRIRAHTWPGNVRELRNVIERAVLLSDGEQIEAADLRPLGSGGAAEASAWRPELPPGGLAWDELERAVLMEALRRSRFVQKDAAALLRISRRRLNYMVRRMGITHPSWRRNKGRGREGGPPRIG